MSLDPKAIKNSKQVWGLFGWFNFLDTVAESGRFNQYGLTPVQSVLAGNALEIFIWAGHNHMTKSLQNA